MTSLLRIQYQADYRYEREVSLSPHIVRIFPRTSLATTLEAVSFTCSGGAEIQYRRDLYENEIASCFFASRVASFQILFQATLRLTERNPFHFLLSSDGLSMPPTYSEKERAFLTPFLQCEGGVELPAALRTEGKQPTVETLVAWNQWIFQNLRYLRREEGAAWSPAETLRRGEGSCRDFTALLIEALRQNGTAARWASGFLWEPPGAERSVAHSAMHAWVEAYLPGAGWIGMDPTNGALTDHTAITAATGPSAADVSPVAGTYYSRQTVETIMDSSLQITAASA